MQMAMNGFSPSEDVHKSIILITDSEDHEGAAVDAAKEAANNGIQVNVIGVGSAKGAPIPVGNKRSEYMRDAEGQVVTTTINEKLAKEIAEAGGGIYVNGGSTSALSDLMAQLETLQKSEFKRVSYNAGAEQFPTFAWFAFILLLIDTFILDRKISWLKNVNFFSK
jgi:Ca-activated chloride channel family protein